MDAATQTTELIDTSHGQMVALPDEFRFTGHTVAIRREGEAVILEPLKQHDWPDGFFNAIRIDDPAFGRPEQGGLPPVPSLG